ncbi:MAG: hypothetical protein CK424_04990 [Legionella sp.]|nr:MAG: hypothetical protein CK424_04990 [Legionella sp.]
MPKFEKGQSGNPAGKKPGTLNKRTQLSNVLNSHAEDLVKKAIEMALDGDVNALRLCMERLMPKATSQPIQFEIDMGKNDNLSVIGRKIVNAVGKGELTPDEGQKLFGMLDKQRNLIELTDLIKKVEEIEDAMKIGRY